MLLVDEIYRDGSSVADGVEYVRGWCLVLTPIGLGYAWAAWLEPIT